MSLKDRLVELHSVEQLDDFLNSHPTCAIFKAGGCHKTMQGFGVVEEVLNAYDSIHMAFVRVIEQRPVSNYIAQITGVTHQSPQFILIVNKKPVYDVDNWDIVPNAIKKALNDNLGSDSSLANPPSGQQKRHADTKSYKHLLKTYVSGEILEEDFKLKWLKMFQMDASLRSTEEFSLLNSLFGDVDKALNGVSETKERLACVTEPLKLRAAKLLKELNER